MVYNGTMPFWGFPDATNTGCEDYYDVVPFVAEFWNTLCTLPFIYASLYMVQRFRDFDPQLNWLFLMVCIGGALTNFYHLTARAFFEVMDYLPSAYCICIAFQLVYEAFEAYIAKTRKKVRKMWLGSRALEALLALFVVATTIDQLFFKTFTTLISVVLYGIVFGTVCLSGFLGMKHPGAQTCVYLTLSLFLSTIGFFIWYFDSEKCDEPREFPIHFFWHLFNFFGLFLWALFIANIRGKYWGYRVRFSFRHLIKVTEHLPVEDTEAPETRPPHAVRLR